MKLAGQLFLLLGAFLCFLGALGIVRMPDAYSRIQAGTKAVTLGTLAVLAGVGFHHPDWWAKLLAVAGLLLLANPVASSTLSRALYLAGVRPWRARQEEGEP